jgi:hypothetical protein
VSAEPQVGIGEDKKGPLFRTAIRRTGVLSTRPLPRVNAYHLIQRRAKEAGIQNSNRRGMEP